MDPNFPVPAAPLPTAPQDGEGISDVQANTSPGFPPVPQDAGQGMEGIETPDMADNLPA